MVDGHSVSKTTKSKAQLINELKKCNQRISELEKTLVKCKENEILLSEIHHRVRNNMQIISSLLRLQSKKTKDKKFLDMLRICQNRIRSMSLIHEKFCCSKDPAKIELAQYIHDLAHHLFHSYGVDPDNIKLNSWMEDIQIDINRAIPLGLIINELITNSLKHAFPDGKKGKIQINLHPNNQGKFEFVVKDNGIGFPKDSGSRDSDSLGMQLVNRLVEQIDGNIELHREGGTQFNITF
jgi:two-component sensor histidine kinase